MADVQYHGQYAPQSESFPSYTSHDPSMSVNATTWSASHQSSQAPNGPNIARVVNVTGALLSVALVAGMGVWAWHLVMRDVADVPVIRAMEGAMRNAPVDPGGAVAENQGLAVNRLAEGAEAAPVPDQLVLAPAPIDLGPVPQELAELAFQNGSAASGTGETTTTPEDAVATAQGPDATEQNTAALIERLIAEAQPLAPLDEPDLGDGAPSFSIVPASVPGVDRSPRPPVRPASLVIEEAITVEENIIPVQPPEPQAEVAAPTPDDAPITAVELTAADLPDGTRLVQLGAFDSPDLARTEWERLTRTYTAAFAERARVIEEATSGGQTFYRLRAHGFEDLAASRRFCADLVAQGSACIPVTVR